MKKLLAVAVVGLASASANATGSYVLFVVNGYSPFAPTGTSVMSGPIATGGSASIDGLGNVFATGIQHSFVSGSSTYNYTGGVWSAVVGGTSVSHTESCVQAAGNTSCTQPLNGLAGLWNSTQQNGGAISNACGASLFFAAGGCDRVLIQEVAGVSLLIVEQSEFAIPGLPSGLIYRFTAVPVPAAVWLFGSALGLLGLRRRVAQ